MLLRVQSAKSPESPDALSGEQLLGVCLRTAKAGATIELFPGVYDMDQVSVPDIIPSELTIRGVAGMDRPTLLNSGKFQRMILRSSGVFVWVNLKLYR